MADYMGNDDMGDDEMGDDEILGAVARRARKAQLVGRNRAPVKVRGFLGLGEARFIAGGPTSITLEVEPQRAFRGERLVIARRESGGVTVASSTRVQSIFIGDKPQSPSIQQPAPTEMFSPDATESGVDFDKAVPGVKILVTLTLTGVALAGAEFVSLNCGMYGDMLH